MKNLIIKHFFHILFTQTTKNEQSKQNKSAVKDH